MRQSLIALLTPLLASFARGQPPERTYDLPLKNFTQRLDHSGNNSVTFPQRYQLDTSHFKPGGPILFHQSEEGKLVPLDQNMFFDYAKELGAISCTLEHRFFGTSFPEGLSVTSNITTEQFRPLTLDNILLDSVNFVNWVRKTVPGAQDSKVIYTGGEHLRSEDRMLGTKLTNPTPQARTAVFWPFWRACITRRPSTAACP